MAIKSLKEFEKNINKLKDPNRLHRSFLIQSIDEAVGHILNVRSGPQPWVIGSIGMALVKLIRLSSTYDIDIYKLASPITISDSEIRWVVDSLNGKPNNTVAYQQIVFWIEQKSAQFGIPMMKLFEDAYKRTQRVANGGDWWE